MAYLPPEACQVTNGLVFVIDDDPSVRRSVSRLLRSHERVVHTCQSAKDFLELELPSSPACIVLDLEMPEVDGLELQRLLHRNSDTLPIIFISGHGNVPASVRAMKEGAVDFLTKPFHDDELMAAIDTALERAKSAQDRRNALQRDQHAFNSLTHRERQVCVRVAEGMLNKQIGGELGTSEKTIKAQRGQVMQKLGAQSVTDVVRLVDRLRASGQLEHQFSSAEN
jgi:FixJ family two-component response regulator